MTTSMHLKGKFLVHPPHVSHVYIFPELFLSKKHLQDILLFFNKFIRKPVYRIETDWLGRSLHFPSRKIRDELLSIQSAARGKTSFDDQPILIGSP